MIRFLPPLPPGPLSTKLRRLFGWLFIAIGTAKLLGWNPSARGELYGRVLEEAINNGGSPVVAEACVASSAPAADGRRTVLEYQRVQGRIYVDVAHFDNTAPLTSPCRPGRR